MCRGIKGANIHYNFSEASLFLTKYHETWWKQWNCPYLAFLSTEITWEKPSYFLVIFLLNAFHSKLQNVHVGEDLEIFLSNILPKRGQPVTVVIPTNAHPPSARTPHKEAPHVYIQER